MAPDAEDTGVEMPRDASVDGPEEIDVLAELGVDISEIASGSGLRIDLWGPQLTRVKEILEKRERHAAVLVGPRGVGKRAVVVALARDIEAGRVPRHLRGRRVIELPFHRVLASARQPGDFERVTFLALREAAGREDVILYLNHLPNFMGVGAGPKGLFNASYAIEMACHQPRLLLLSSATPELYRAASRSSPWLAASLARVDIPEPSREASLELLSELVGPLSEYHGVRFEDQAIEDAVDLSAYYLKERVLPGKAIELLDEAASKAATEAGEDGGVATRGHVVAALSGWIGIPEEKLAGPRDEKLVGLEEMLGREVRGQGRCIRKLADVIRVTKLGLDARPARPDGVLLFVGPSGVGKSELARVLADVLFGGTTRLFELNMARYSDDDGLAKFVGLRLGDVEHVGDLTGPVSRFPHCVVVLEQIERSHRDVAVALMQIFRDGSIVDGRGETVHFSNATIIMTSNSENLVPNNNDEEAVGFGPAWGGVEERRFREVRQAIEQFFPPEFMDGIDEVLVFPPLSEAALREIVQLHLEKIRARLAARGCLFDITDAAVGRIAEKGHSREYGARNLGRTVEGLVLKPLARFLLEHPDARHVLVAEVEGDIEVQEPGAGAPAPEGTTR